MPHVVLVSALDRAFDPNADPRNVAMIRRRHALWAELSRLLIPTASSEHANPRIARHGSGFLAVHEG